MNVGANIKVRDILMSKYGDYFLKAPQGNFRTLGRL